MKLKKVFFTGLLVWAPVIITIWIVKLVVMTLDGFISYLPSSWQPSNILGSKIAGIGFFFSIAIVFITGLIASNYVGRRLVELGDLLFARFL